MTIRLWKVGGLCKGRDLLLVGIGVALIGCAADVADGPGEHAPEETAPGVVDEPEYPSNGEAVTDIEPDVAWGGDFDSDGRVDFAFAKIQDDGTLVGDVLYARKGDTYEHRRATTAYTLKEGVPEIVLPPPTSTAWKTLDVNPLAQQRLTVPGLDFVADHWIEGGIVDGSVNKAVAPPANCALDWVCAYHGMDYPCGQAFNSHFGFDDGHYGWIGIARGGCSSNVGNAFNDWMGSWINHSNDDYEWFEHQDFQGAQKWMSRFSNNKSNSCCTTASCELAWRIQFGWENNMTSFRDVTNGCSFYAGWW